MTAPIDPSEFIKNLCLEYNSNPDELVNILFSCQDHFGYISADTQLRVAENLKISPDQITTIVEAYGRLTTVPKVEFPILVCCGTRCSKAGSANILAEFEHTLGINTGQQTSDLKFSLNIIRCVGACNSAPIILVGAKLHGRVDTEKVQLIISDCNG